MKPNHVSLNQDQDSFKCLQSYHCKFYTLASPVSEKSHLEFSSVFEELIFDKPFDQSKVLDVSKRLAKKVLILTWTFQKAQSKASKV